MGSLSTFGTIFNFSHLAYAAKVKFRQLQSMYRPGKLSLEQIFLQTVTREDVPSQMLNMAAKFDINEHDIARPNWRAVWTVENCNSCWAGLHCFRDKENNATESPGIIPKRCPNFAIFQCIATEKHTVEAEKQAVEHEKAAKKELEQYIEEQLNLSRSSRS